LSVTEERHDRIVVMRYCLMSDQVLDAVPNRFIMKTKSAVPRIAVTWIKSCGLSSIQNGNMNGLRLSSGRGLSLRVE
jgi:hypothetical protein